MQLITIAGNIGKDAVIRTTGGGDNVANFSVAVDGGKDKNGNKRDATWYDCSLWGKRGDALAQYLTKGSKVTVHGRPTVRVHEGKAYLGVNVNEITLQGQSGGQGNQSSGNRDPAKQEPQDDYDLDDDIPF